ncbi:MAG: phosphoribosylaminoimidazolesuccinocarboxamide synthase [Syntrophaceae bacterium]|nr:phosphoribosylaminoimidazolesuccinocarboxamide synthase [Syntrophaceae bacterium]
MSEKTIKETNLDSLKLMGRGKVRDIYDLDDRLLIVSTDRLSAFDVILPNPIPKKGQVLNKLSSFWMNKTAKIAPNHLISSDIKEFPGILQKYGDQLDGRSMLVKRAKTFPVECVVRGYIIGSGWEDYKKTGAICGINLPSGLKQADKLSEPIFTPSTKAEIGKHDENISFSKTVDILGADTANWLRDTSLQLYEFGARWAEQRGIIIADTKFEFGIIDGTRSLIDEVLTPDSSRFWPQDQYEPGISPPSLDKQYVRDYLQSIKWNKEPPAPQLPEEVVRNVSQKYINIYKILTGEEI